MYWSPKSKIIFDLLIISFPLNPQTTIIMSCLEHLNHITNVSILYFFYYYAFYSMVDHLSLILLLHHSFQTSFLPIHFPHTCLNHLMAIHYTLIQNYFPCLQSSMNWLWINLPSSSYMISATYSLYFSHIDIFGF